MKANKRPVDAAQRHDDKPYTVDLTQQERRALSLVWSESSTEGRLRKADPETEHCAVLGYN